MAAFIFFAGAFFGTVVSFVTIALFAAASERAKNKKQDEHNEK